MRISASTCVYIRIYASIRTHAYTSDSTSRVFLCVHAGSTSVNSGVRVFCEVYLIGCQSRFLQAWAGDMKASGKLTFPFTWQHFDSSSRYFAITTQDAAKGVQLLYATGTHIYIYTYTQTYVYIYS